MHCLHFALQPSPSSGSEARVEVVFARKSVAEIQMTFLDSQGITKSIEEAVDDHDEVNLKCSIQFYAINSRTV